MAKILLFLLLIGLPIAGRWLWLNFTRYDPGEIPEVQDSQIRLPEVTYTLYEDTPVQAEGRVVLDLAHDNNLLIDDLTPLRDRLAARGVSIETYDGYSTTLEQSLRGAVAYVVVAPAYEFYEEEVDAVLAFVQDGGHVLIAADPTRPAYADSYDLFSVFFPVSAIPSVNSISQAFGIVYFDDYLYNLEENAGNYRNVSISGFAEGQALTQGLETIILNATHSLEGPGEVILAGDAQTHSNVRTGEENLAAGILTAEGRVLALGDMTLMTTPYHTIADNDHFLSNIADWMVGAQRQWDLQDFPYLFDGPVDLVKTTDEPLDTEWLSLQETLQYSLDQAGIEVTLRSEPDADHDVLYFGTFDALDTVQAYLDEAGIVIDLPSQEESDSGLDEEDEEPPQDTVAVPELGTFLAPDTALFLVGDVDSRVVLVVLAWDEAAVRVAVERLSDQDLVDCANTETIYVCTSQGDTSHEDDDYWDDSGTDDDYYYDVSSVFILSNDDGAIGVQTSQTELEELLSPYYTVTIWSTNLDGIPSESDLDGYDAVIYDSGDYAADDTDMDVLDVIFSFEGSMAILGDQALLPSFMLATLPAPLYDLELVDTEHPLAYGFPEEPLTLLESLSGVESLVISEEDFTLDETTSIVLSRGPTSPSAGTPVLIASDDTYGRYVLGAFALYRLPDDVRITFIYNLVSWLLYEY
ncbi:MAG: hypothetical protein JW726_17815 [Anaerolineales bacterium]|nr:hypothetical protein [Anaerolineales bacterium]